MRNTKQVLDCKANKGTTMILSTKTKPRTEARKQVMLNIPQIKSIEKMKKKRYIEKYKTDQYYKESFKRKCLERYASNEQHRAK